ncbi:MAG: TetR/AcrR family transcriptional regulator [Planctomycetota bacterium]|jgi:AcrR family transcriptional regulator
MTHPTRWLTRDDWIAAALDTLRREGVAQVRVESLARKLGVTKGSFYGHFRNHRELLDGVLELWERRSTRSVAKMLDRLEPDASRRLLLAMEGVVFNDRGKHDAAVRAWAMHDEAARRAVLRVDRWRHRLGTALFEAIGFNPEEAEKRARITSYFLIGEAMTTPKGTKHKRRTMLRALHQMLVQPLAGEAFAAMTESALK